jgi:hypothetical protein
MSFSDDIRRYRVIGECLRIEGYRRCQMINQKMPEDEDQMRKIN